MSELVGMTIPLDKVPHVVEHPSEPGSETTVYTYTLKNAKEAQRLVKYHLGGGDVRIKIPGHLYTADIQPTRYNVHLDTEGVVTEITIG